MGSLKELEIGKGEEKGSVKNRDLIQSITSRTSYSIRPMLGTM